MPAGCLDETQALAFVANELPPDLRTSLEEHVDDCDACRRVLAELVKRRKSNVATDKTALGRPAGAIGTDRTHLAHGSAPDTTPVHDDALERWTPGTRVGRYVVLARIGRGGMGTVFRAEDVELGRAVALKRLHADADSEARARLLREARSAAQLQHPNVVMVHEVGEDAGTPFLAMELVDGVTLTAWLRERTRTWREVAGIVAQAGRGLAAAHERGLVHRDFKPDNILIDRAGRARVADFGLARAGGAEIGAKPSRDERLARMTATGSLAGTPAYMAPELVEGAPPDARSDQYAFAVTLHEALRGQHPFEGDTAAKLWLEMAEGRIRSGGRSIPAWLDKHVRRGLAVMPAQRWPDLASFVAAIEKPPRRRLWLGAGVGAIAIASTIAFVATREPAATGPTCEDLAAEYNHNVSEADLARALPDPQQRDIATKALDKFIANYRKAMRDSCRATRAGKQSAEMGDKRNACLEHAGRRAWFVTSDIGASVDERPGLSKILDELPDATACNDPEWLTRAAPLPLSKTDREAIYLAESNLIHAGKVRDLGRLDQASMLVNQAIETAKRLHDRSLDARANLFASEIAKDRGDMDQATVDAVEAWSAASAGGDTQLTIEAQLAMLLATASRDRRAIEGFSGLGKVTESAEGARLIQSHADALMASGHFKEAEAEYRRAQAMREKVLPAAHVDRALGLQRLGACLVVQKRASDALPILEQAHAVVEKAFPPLRREAIDGIRYFAMAEEELGNLERALELRREVYDRRARVHGAKHGMALDARGDVARLLGDLGHEAEAIAELEAVIAGFLALGEGSVNAADARVTLANKLISVGRIADADAQLAKAVPMLARAHGADSPYTMVGDYAQVRSWVERPKPIQLDEATRQLDRIEPVFAKLFGAKSFPVAAVTGSRARIAFAKNDAAGADQLTAAAIAMLGDDKRADRAEVHMFRATVLYKLGKRDDARASAEAAAKDYDNAGAGFSARAAASRAWIAKPTATAAAPATSASAPAAMAAVAPGACDKAGREFDIVWPEEREDIVAWHEKDRDRGDRIGAVIDRYVADWKASARSACVDKANGLYDRRMMCLDRARAGATARISSVGNGTIHAIEDRKSLPDFTSCANPQHLTKLVMPASADQREAIERSERELEYARITLDIDFPTQADRHLNTWGRDAIEKAGDPSITARAEKLRAEIKVKFDAKRAAKAANKP